MDQIIRDVRYTVRSLWRTPIFATTVILTRAVGIGADTAVFSLVDRLLLRLHEISPRGRRMDVSPANRLDWQRDSKSFELFAAWTNRIPLTKGRRPTSSN